MALCCVRFLRRQLQRRSQGESLMPKRTKVALSAILLVIVSVSLQANTLHYYNITHTGSSWMPWTGEIVYDTAKHVGSIRITWSDPPDAQAKCKEDEGGISCSYVGYPRPITLPLALQFWNFVPTSECLGSSPDQTGLNILKGCNPGLTLSWAAGHLGSGDSSFEIRVTDKDHQYPDACPAWNLNFPPPRPDPKWGCAFTLVQGPPEVFNPISGEGTIEVTKLPKPVSEPPAPFLLNLAILGIAAVTRRNPFRYGRATPLR